MTDAKSKSKPKPTPETVKELPDEAMTQAEAESGAPGEPEALSDEELAEQVVTANEIISEVISEIADEKTETAGIKPGLLKGAIRTEGSSLFVNDVRVAICGTDANRSSNGPQIAEYLAGLIEANQ